MIGWVLALALVQESYAPDTEGFIRNWLVLAPIPCEAESNGAVEIDTQQLPGEARLAPRAGERARANGAERAWTEHRASAYYIDFLRAFGRERGEHAVAYAVAYVHAEAERPDLRLRVGSNDQCKAYVNGLQLLRFDETRSLEKDQNEAKVGLRKGRNVVLLKVLNESNQWQGCLRFTTPDGAPVRDLKITLAP